MAHPSDLTTPGVSKDLEDCKVDFSLHLHPGKVTPCIDTYFLASPKKQFVNQLTNPTVRESETPIIFSWSPSAAEIPPSNFNNNISWIEGPGQEWIAVDHHAGCVRLDIDPFAPTIIVPHTALANEKTSVTSASASTPRKSQLKLRDKEYNKQSESQPRPQPPPGYPITTAPFHLFLKFNLIPIDLDSDVVWLHEGNVFRAYRISTTKPDDTVIPNLTVGGEPPLTIWEYLDAVRRWREENHRESAGAAAEEVVLPADDAVPPRVGNYLGGKVLHGADTDSQDGAQQLQVDPRLVRASMPRNRRFVEGQGPRFPLMPVRESALIEYIQKSSNTVVDLISPNSRYGRPATHPTAAKPQTFTPKPSMPLSIPINAHPNDNRPSPPVQNSKHPYSPPVSLQKDAAPPTSKRPASSPLPSSRSHQPPSLSPLPSLPSRKDRIRTIQTFNQHAASTFSSLKRQRCQRIFEEERRRKYLVAARRWGMGF
ncbi:MAG: hypothetical protein Q9188_006174 [Gyalolechia gomerana]